MHALILLVATAAAAPAIPVPIPSSKPIRPAPNPNLPEWVTDLPRPTADASHCNQIPGGDCPHVVGYDCSGGCCGCESRSMVFYHLSSAERG